jgi:hypothetical protein
MATLSEPKDHKDNSAEREDFDYNDFLSDEETTAVNYDIPTPPPRVSVTIHLDDKHNQLKKIHIQKRDIK